MTKKYNKDLILLNDARKKITGANIHDAKSVITLYNVRISQYNRDMKNCDLEYVKIAERRLRNFVEGKENGKKNN